MIEVRVRDVLSKRRVTEYDASRLQRWSKFFCLLPSQDYYKIPRRATSAIRDVALLSLVTVCPVAVGIRSEGKVETRPHASFPYYCADRPQPLSKAYYRPSLLSLSSL